MRGSLSALRTAGPRRVAARRAPVFIQSRAIRISGSAATEHNPEASAAGRDAFGSRVTIARDSADARFDTLPSPSAPSSLLSVDLSASQQLFTRRGTLVGATGDVQNVNSRLSLLSPIRRAILGIPFLYQRISSTTPITLLIAAKSPATTISLLHLDGTTDWQIAQRNALLAWTGHTLAVSPRTQKGMSLAHWGNSFLTGRGVAALASPGQVYEVTVAEGEELVVHPSHVIAYSVNKNAPQPFRFKSSSVRFQVPAVPASIVRMSSDMTPAGWTKFWNAMRHTDTYKFVAGLLYALRTNARRSIWGDRLFLQFRGPSTLLMSSRGVRVSDVLTRDDVNEIADVEAGVVPAAIELATKPPVMTKPSATDTPTAIHVATVGKGGKVHFEETKDLKQFVQ